MLLILVACGAPERSGSPTRTPTVPPNEVSGLDIPPGRVDAAIGKLDGLADELMKRSGIPGMAVAVVHDGKVVYAKGFDVKDGRTGAKVDADTVFQLASLSKPVGATVVAREVTHNVVGWDMPVWVTLPWFALSDPYVSHHVTIADLYAHRSGLPDHAGDGLEDLGYDRRQVLERLKYLPLSAFRTNYDYTNFGVTAAAEAVAAAAQKPWEDLSDEVLYRPLGMASTSSRFADYQSRLDRAVAHVKTPNGYQPLYTRDADAQSPAGGVSSSVNDMARWLMMVLGNGTYNGIRIAAQDALLPAVTPQIVSLPSANVGLIALTNAAPIGVPETLAAQFMDLVQYGEVREDWAALYTEAFDSMDRPEGSLVGRQAPANPAPARPLNAYVGEYANPYWGPAKVTEANGVLQLSLGPRGDTFPLSTWDSDTFTFMLQGENAPSGTVSKATFNGNELTLEYFDRDKLGTFTR